MTVMRTIANFRELGGLTGAGGRRVASGRLFRSANPSLADDGDLDALAALGLDEIVDLRADDEKSTDRPIGARFRWTSIPVITGDMSRELAERPDEDADTRMLRVYRRLALEYGDAYRALLARAEAGSTMLVHCAAGKDRTGVAFLLLLTALGVPLEQILEDFLASNQARDDLLRQFMPRLIADGIDPGPMLKLLEVRDIYLHTAIREIEQAHGSIECYLTDGLGVDIERIRGHYLEG